MTNESSVSSFLSHEMRDDFDEVDEVKELK